MSNIRRIRRTLGANLYGQGINVMIQIGAVPLYLTAWGVSSYRDWLLLSTVPAYLGASDLGFISAASNSMSAARARGDREQEVVVYRSVWLLATALSVSLVAILVLGSLAFDPGSLLAIRTLDFQQVVLALVLLGAYAAICQQESLLQAGFRAEGRNPLGIVVTNSARLIEVATAVSIAALGGNPVGAAAGLLAVRSCSVLLQYILLIRVAPHLSISLNGASKHAMRQLWGPSIAFLALPVGNLLTLQGFLLLVAHYADSSALVAFSLVRTLSRFGTQTIGVLEASVWPEVSYAYGRGDLKALKQLHNRSCAVSFYLAAAAAIGLCALGEPIMRIWTGGRVDPPILLIVLLALDLVLTSLWTTSTVLPAATNRLKYVSVSYLSCGTLSLMVVPLFVSSWGIVGAPAALALGNALMIPLVVGHSMRLLDENVVEFTKTFGLGSSIQTIRFALGGTSRNG